ncbi:MAG: WG repeat-containing protein, partial [Ferruginibacter sp.]
GMEIIKPEYADGLAFQEGYTAVKSGTKWQYLDSTGKVITAAIFDDALSFSSGLAAVSKANFYGFINTNGEAIIPFEFSNARSFSEGLAPASNSKGYWGYIDNKGTWAIKPVYSFTDNFENGEARVMKGEKILYIDKSNKVLHE